MAPQPESQRPRPGFASSFRTLPGDPATAPRSWIRLAPVLAAVLAGSWILASGAAGLKRFREARERHDRMAARVESLDAERQRLEEAVRRLEEDPNALELLAKSSHFLSAPDEIVVLLPEGPDQ